ncbi:hypothetical protein PFICI_14474 [Pestalotiopsis fici W106-1]|uniref:L-ornithine N(5)-monooxygenase [NAD(P)H] n=1 Tax=Pestalotiopsis fici (strain W106-1 / CGMCC3.15140) TaxID=1229662 RepID=W3WI09_PESFW|nr:uncharacterized protein PFICI_14474 [Pestalotiopsis fici W106-1]ETS73528.1 hypothetical protein PFICI_14474 [Pestalotiopsis fici W106-1]
MAKAHLEVHPNASMLVLDSAKSVGGVWAKERLYPGLKTNNLLGSYEFSDFPMSPGRFDVRPGEHISGDAVHDYLEQFANHFGIASRLRLGHTVESAELLDSGDWLLQVVSVDLKPSRPPIERVIARKMVVATGLTSKPYIPTFSGQDLFNRDLFHAKELSQRSNSLKQAKHVVVIGGNKSAWDACFSVAEAGAQAHMIIRPSGGGPSWVWPVLFSPLKLSIQRLASTRFATWFDPCIWTEKKGLTGWIRRFLHETRLGRIFVSAFWRLLQYYAYKSHRYNDHPETQKLKPWVNPFWMGNSLSIHNYSSSWFDLVRQGRITIHIADVGRLSEGRVHLSDDTTLDADALVCCTGWIQKPSIQFLRNGTNSKIGLNTRETEVMNQVAMARKEIYHRMPALRQPPRIIRTRETPQATLDVSNRCLQTEHRFQLYRFIIPADGDTLRHKNLAFIGSHLALTAVMISQLQALWITAFFSNEINTLKTSNIDFARVMYETILHNEYTRIRHPPTAGGCGERCPDLTFDCLPYMDLLMQDLGLNPFRRYKRDGFWSEICGRYMPSDYKGIVQEWMDTKRPQS